MSSTGSAGPGVDYYYDPSLKGVTINYLASAKPENTIAYSYIPLFEQETGIKVNITVLDENSVNEKAATVFAAKAGTYDVIDAGELGATSYTWWNQGAVTPLSNFFSITPSGYDVPDINPSIIASVSTFKEDTPPGAVTGLPIGYGIQGAAIRSDLASKAGFTLPMAGQVEKGSYHSVPDGTSYTWEDWLAAATKAAAPPQTYAWLEPVHPQTITAAFWQLRLWSYNKHFINHDFTPNFTDPDVIAATKLFVNTVNTYLPDPTTFSFGDFFNLATAGRCVTGWNSGDNASNFFTTGSSLNGENWKQCWYPKEKVHPLMVAAATMTINAYSTNQKAAWSMISFITSPRMQKIFTEKGVGTMRLSPAKDPALLAADDWVVQWPLQPINWLNEAVPVGSKNAKNLVYAPIFIKMPNTLDLYGTIGTELDLMLAGEKVEDGLNNLQTAATTFLKGIDFYGKKTYDFAQ